MSAETANGAYKGHGFSLEDRKAMKLHGVTDATGFDEQTVTLETTCGRMEIGGVDLHIEVLNLKDGVVEIVGQIDSVNYFANEPAEKTRKSFWRKFLS